MAPLQSTKRFRLLHALMIATREDSFVCAKNAAPGLSNTEEAHAMLTDPNYPDCVALDDFGIWKPTANTTASSVLPESFPARKHLPAPSCS